MNESELSWKQVTNSIYHPSFNYKVLSPIKDFYTHTHISEFGFARRALYEGLKKLNLSAGFKVLLPSFICRDLLSPFHSLGIEIAFYNVTKDLKLACQVEELPKANAILAIHWFGLETDLSPYITYCTLHQAYLLEDNAHGLFSRGSSGKILGETGDLGIISVRKTLPVYTGALLLLKEKPNGAWPPKKVIHIPLVFQLKKFLRPLIYLVGNRPLNFFVFIKRFLRQQLLGNKTPISTSEDEFVLPDNFIDKGTGSYCQKVDFHWEIQRRRELYLQLHEKLKDMPIEILKKELGQFEVPYCFPFYCSDENFNKVERHIKKQGLEIVKWPALPQAVINVAPQYYQQFYFIKFLW